MLKKLKPDPSRDNLSDPLHSAAISNRQPTLHYLLELGANPNNKPNGGSRAVDTTLWHLDVAGSNLQGGKGRKPKYVAWKELACPGELLAHGAIWNPNEKYQVNSLRGVLLGYEPELITELLQMFRKYNACPAERVHALLGTPRMKEHMKPQEGALLRLGIRLDAAAPPKRRK